LWRLRSYRCRFGLVVLGFTASTAAVILLASRLGVAGSPIAADEAYVNSVTVLSGMSEAQAVQAVTDVTDWDDRADHTSGDRLGPWRSIYVIDCHGNHRKLYGDATSVPCL